MVRLAQTFLKVARWSHAKSSVRNLKITHQLAKSGAWSPFKTLMVNLFTYKGFRRAFLTLLGVSLLSGLGAILFMTLLIGIKAYLISVGAGGVVDAMPLSLADIARFLNWFLALSFSWTVMVSMNHFGDIGSLVAQANLHSFFDYVGFIAGYIWTVNISMMTEFTQCLLYTPQAIMNTRAVLELILAVDLIGSVFTLVRDTIAGITFLPLSLQVLLVSVADLGGAVYQYTTSFIGGVISTSWTWFVSGIAQAITPVVPTVIQPVINPIFHGIATTIGIGIIVVVLRYFGFPF